jgi:hypothetical protein
MIPAILAKPTSHSQEFVHMPRLKIASLIAVLAIAATACGSGGSTAAPRSGGQGSTEPGATEPAAVVPSFAAAGGGSCGVQIDGDVTKSWHTDQTTGTLLVSYWLTPGDRTLVGVANGDEELLINCQSDEGSISFTTTAGTTAAQLPKAAGTYVIERKPGEIQTIINLKDSKVWNVTAAGTFEITSFTPSSLAGSFNFKIGRSDVGSQTVVATATVSGTFDLACTGSACG